MVLILYLKSETHKIATYKVVSNNMSKNILYNLKDSAIRLFHESIAITIQNEKNKTLAGVKIHNLFKFLFQLNVLIFMSMNQFLKKREKKQAFERHRWIHCFQYDK